MRCLLFTAIDSHSGIKPGLHFKGEKKMPTLVYGLFKRGEVLKLHDLAGGLLVVVINRKHSFGPIGPSAFYEVVEVVLDEKKGFEQKTGMGSLSSFEISHDEVEECIGTYKFK